jgi:hypothetical protein
MEPTLLKKSIIFICLFGILLVPAAFAQRVEWTNQEVEFAVTALEANSIVQYPWAINPGYNGAWIFQLDPYGGMGQTFTVPTVRVLQSVQLRVGGFGSPTQTGQFEVSVWEFDNSNNNVAVKLAYADANAEDYRNFALSSNVPVSTFDMSGFGAVLDPSKTYAIEVAPLDSLVGTLSLQSDMDIYPGGEAYSISQPFDTNNILIGIDIAGPDEVPEESVTPYQVVGNYSNGSTENITADAVLSLDSDEFATINADGILSTDRLYRPVETFTIYAESHGLSASKQITTYPVCDGDECSQEQLISRNIDDVIEIKQAVRKDLAYAIKIERASLQLIDKPGTGKKCNGSNHGQLNKARIHLLAALIRELWADKEIDKSIDFLQVAQRILQE